MKLGLWIIKKLLSELIIKKDDLNYYEVLNNYNDYHKQRTNIQSQLDRAKVISRWVPSNANLADIGCGSGTIATYLRNNNKPRRIVCYDLPTEELMCVRNKGFETHTIDLEDSDIDIPDDQYDYILLIDVLEHLSNPQIVLRELVQKAKIAVIVSFPNSGYWLYRLQLLYGYFPRQSFTHLHYWTYKDFKIFCENLGIEIIDFKHEEYEDGLFSNLLYKRCCNLVCKHLFFKVKNKA